MSVIACMSCGQQLPVTWTWYVCTVCGFRICPTCLGSHHGPFGYGTFKCSQCAFGQLVRR